MQVGSSTYIGEDIYKDNSEHDQSDSESESSNIVTTSPHSPKYVVTEKKNDDDDDGDSFFDYRLGWAFGFFLMAIALIYFYYDSVACCITENEETNLTMQYAIEKSDMYSKNKKQEEANLVVTTLAV